MRGIPPAGRGSGAARVALAVLMLVGLRAPVGAQLFDGVDWFERKVGEGVVWRHYWFDNLFGSRQSLSYLEVDLDEPGVIVEFPFLVASRDLTSSLVPAQFPDAVAAVNGTFFDTSPTGGGTTTYLRVNGELVDPTDYTPNRHWNNSAGLARGANGTMRILARPAEGDNWRNEVDHTDIMAGGPMLLVDGSIADFSAAGSYCTNRGPRTFAGIAPGNRLILATADGRTASATGLTCEEMALVMEGLGCREAFGLDGGGSTTLWIKGEPDGGVANFPSDNGTYDHLGERPCSSAIAVRAHPPASPPDYDARLVSVSHLPDMVAGTTQTVAVSYENIGARTWTRETTTLRVSRPESRTSALQHESWPSASQPAAMTPESVAPGQTATFLFDVQGPEGDGPTALLETFALHHSDVGRFGPADSAVRLSIFVRPSPGNSIIVESRRPDGTLTPSMYEETGSFADTSSKSIPVEGPALAGAGARFVPSEPSSHGKKARFRPMLPSAGNYNVYVTVGNGPNNDALAKWELVNGTNVLAGGTVQLAFHDPTVANAWKPLASGIALPAGSETYIEFTNMPGGANRFVMDAVQFERVEEAPKEAQPSPGGH